MSYIPRLKTLYKEEVIQKMKDQFSYSSPMEVPKLLKITINQGIGEAALDKKIIDEAIRDLSLITGQRPVSIKAKSSVSNFKLREGMVIGVKVTLRDSRMYEFLDRFINVALPRVKDFRGINDKGFDGRGNYSVGVKEHIIFPEIKMESINKVLGMDISIVTTAKTDAEALALLKHFGMPFKNQRN
jgi:large subunit ribosomal protein L5